MLRTVLEGAETNNLKGVSLELAPGELVVIAGVSGSGKSSLAMDTLYAEGQRRFVESFSPYARQFLERLERPPMKRLEPVPAGIAVDRRAPIKSSRSTVATMADIEPYLGALFLREALPVCPEHLVEAEWLDVNAAAERIALRFGERRTVVTYPMGIASAEAYLELRDALVKDGYRRAFLGGKAVDFDALAPSQALAEPELEVVVDRLAPARDRQRLAQGVEAGWSRAEGRLRAHADGESLVVRRGLACPSCARSLAEPRQGLFSYDSPIGACAECRGFGRTLGIDVRKVIPDSSLSIEKGAVRPWRGRSTSWERGQLKKLCARHRVPTGVPWEKLNQSQRAVVLEGEGSWTKGKFPGVLGWFRWLETKTYKLHVRVLLSRYRAYDPCRSCGGKRLNETALAYRVGAQSLADWHALEIGDARRLVAELETRTGQGELARRELESRLAYLERVGLGYLTLDRQARTLSGGEAQRVTLTAALGTSLVNALFVLDEPTVGLHPSDIPPMNAMLRELADRDNTVLVVEHDPAILAAADRIVELGPGSGADGGRITGDGPPSAFHDPSTATGRALYGAASEDRRPRTAKDWLEVEGARANNLEGVNVRLPLGVICAVTGPSGSGKSTLIVDVVYRVLARRLGDLDEEEPGEHDRIGNAGGVKRVTLVDQLPLGRTSRGNAATYTKAWDAIRAAYARQPEALARSLLPSAFSFNVEGGRCESCAGEGYETVEMQFLADVRLVCPSCRGRRFQDRVLAVKYRGVSVAELLETTVERALEIFASDAAVQRALGPVARLGLDYLTLGQPLTTLSGGEAQRLKLARALAERHEGALFILDEPSAGLHSDEVLRLLGALDVIVAGGGSVFLVEHDLDLVRAADYVVDLGPGAGRAGGRVVATGTPESVAESSTRTGLALRAARAPRAPAPDRARRDTGTPERATLAVTRAREHNLKEISVEIPHGALTVVTGPSGSGKSTLAFDVVFAEGQRRFLETLTPYARQFLPTMPRPDVDAVSGVPPSIALEQRTARAGATSTVATVTEVAHYLRLLYAKVATPHCPLHDQPIARTSPEAVRSAVRKLRGQRYLLAPVVKARKGTYLDVFTAARRAGILQAFADGALVSTDDPPRLKKAQEHDIELLIAGPLEPRRFDDEAIERALAFGGGELALRAASGEREFYSTTSACPACGLSIPTLDPRFFSFNTKQGRCETCEGAGVLETEPPRRGKKSAPPRVRVCPDCSGARLAPIPRAVRLFGERYHELVGRSVGAALERVEGFRFTGELQKLGGPACEELRRRLAFLSEVGLGYLSLDRPARTLSGGEIQRLRLAAQLGAGLTGALYVLDEPTIGLHPRDTRRLLGNLKKLVDLGSTVLVVEHDIETIRAADHLLDLGPGGGSLGGSVVAEGAPRDVLANPSSPTGRALASPPRLREPLRVNGRSEGEIVLRGARENNLKDVLLRVPAKRFVVVAGVSGSGKSTLIQRVLLPAVRQALGLVTEPPGAHDALSGERAVERAVSVDQSPIGRTPRSTPATFLGIWDDIRKLFAATPEAKMLGFGAARFSFNATAGGRCKACEGQGSITHEMAFLPDVIAPCPTCGGRRFEPQTLGVSYLKHSIDRVLALTAEEAARVFVHHPSIAAPLATLCDLGAGYVTLGQGSHTLSGGEAQRLKLATELTAGKRHERTLYVLDEPTTGLHIADVAKLVSVLGRLVDRGDTLLVIEHHPQVIAGADWVIELGPEGGEAGGHIVAQGPPREVAKKATATGRVLAELYREAQGLGARPGKSQRRPSEKLA